MLCEATQGQGLPNSGPAPIFITNLSQQQYLPLSKHRPTRISSSHLKKKFTALLTVGKTASCICRGPQVVNTQGLWLAQRDQSFRTQSRAEAMRHPGGGARGAVGACGAKQQCVGTTGFWQAGHLRPTQGTPGHVAPCCSATQHRQPSEATWRQLCDVQSS